MKREEQVRLTKQKLLTAADQLIVKEGYAAVSVERITKLAGVSKGTFYTYFKKKGDLMIALSQHRFAAINELPQGGHRSIDLSHGPELASLYLGPL